jgi:hypothetical protein
MATCALITNLANQIWQDLGQPSDTPVSYIQSVLVGGASLGRFNALTANCYAIVAGDIVPAMGLEEQGIYTLMYEVDFYTRKINALTNGSDIDYVTIVDGDSRITRTSTLDKIRLLRDMQSQLQRQLRILLSSYRQGRSNARTVDFYDIDSSWAGYIGGPYVDQ